jgi:hypothetical protein
VPGYTLELKTVRIAGIVMAAALVLYVTAVAVLPEWTIVGFHFHWPWQK